MPHHAVALGSVLAALGAKAATGGVDPTVFLSPAATKGASSLVALQSGKAAAAAAPAAAASFFSNGGGDAAAALAPQAASLLAAKGGSSGVFGAAGGKGMGTAFLAKGHGVGSAATTPTVTKVGGTGANVSMLKVGQKAILARKKVRLAKGSKGVKGVKGKIIKRAKEGTKGNKSKARRVKKTKATSENSSSSRGMRKSLGRHLDSHNGDVGGASGGGEGDGGAAAAAPPGPGEETMPGTLAHASNSSSGTGFLQVQQTASSAPQVHAGPTPTTTTVTTTVAPSVTHAATATTAATAATAAAAAKGAAVAGPGQLVEGVGAMHQSAVHGASNAGALPVGPDEAELPLDSNVCENRVGLSSSGGGLLRSFMRGAVGDEEGEGEEGLVHGLSRHLCANLRGNVEERLSAAKAALAGGLGAGAFGVGLHGIDPAAVDTSGFVGGEGVDPSALGAVHPADLDVEEEAMGVVSLLPLFLRKLSLSTAEGGEAHGGKQRRGREELMSLHKDSAGRSLPRQRPQHLLPQLSLLNLREEGPPVSRTSRPGAPQGFGNERSWGPVSFRRRAIGSSKKPHFWQQQQQRQQQQQHQQQLQQQS
ncbi:hypothetical protein Esti_001901 [Eimeria stiedai]